MKNDHELKMFHINNVAAFNENNDVIASIQLSLNSMYAIHLVWLPNLKYLSFAGNLRNNEIRDYLVQYKRRYTTRWYVDIL